MTTYIKIACLLCCLSVAFAQQPSPEIMQIYVKLQKTIAQIATDQNIPTLEIGTKSFLNIVQATPAQLESLASMIKMQISPALIVMLKTKPIQNLVESYKGFDVIPGMKQYNASAFIFLATLISTDSVNQTAQALQTLKMMTGNTSVAPMLNTTMPALLQRHYLTDVYPVLLKNLPSILDKTSDAYLTSIIKLPAKLVRAMIGKSSIDTLLATRSKMAFAAVKGDQQAMRAEMQKLPQIIAKVLAPLMASTKKMSEFQQMKLKDATTRCNIPLVDLKMKSLLQIMLICAKLPEDFPLLKMFPPGQLPIGLVNSKLNDIAQKLKIAVEVLLDKTMMEVAMMYTQSAGINRNHTLVMPVYYAARISGIKISEIPQYTLLRFATKATGLPSAVIAANYKLTQADTALLESTTFATLPKVLEGRMSKPFYKLESLYFRALDPIIRVLTSKNIPMMQRGMLLRNYQVPLNDVSIDAMSKIFKTTKDSILGQSVLGTALRISGFMDETTIKRLGANKTIVTNRVSLKELQHFNSIFGMSGPAVLSAAMVNQYNNNRLMASLFSPLKQLIIDSANRNTYSIQELFRMMPNGSFALKRVAGKMNISRIMLSEMRLGMLQTKMKVAESVFWEQTLFSLLQKLGKKSEEKSPDACATLACGSGTHCVKIPTGAVCRCNKRGSMMKNGKCEKIKGNIIQVTKLKFNQKFKPEYSDTNSVLFKTKAAEIETALKKSLCKKLACISVVVTSIKKGSIVVDVSLVFESDSVTASQVKSATVQAMQSKELMALSPDASTSTQLQVSNSDACKSGIADCGSNSMCTAGPKGSYKCECKKGHHMKHGTCKKSGVLGVGSIIGIIIGVCIVLAIIIIVVVVLKKHKSKKDEDYNVVYNTEDKVQLT